MYALFAIRDTRAASVINRCGDHETNNWQGSTRGADCICSFNSGVMLKQEKTRNSKWGSNIIKTLSSPRPNHKQKKKHRHKHKQIKVPGDG